MFMKHKLMPLNHANLALLALEAEARVWLFSWFAFTCLRFAVRGRRKRKEVDRTPAKTGEIIRGDV